MRVDKRAVDEIYRAKERERRRLANLPMSEKVKLVVAMQKRADGILRASGRKGREVWNVPSSS